MAKAEWNNYLVLGCFITFNILIAKCVGLENLKTYHYKDGVGRTMIISRTSMETDETELSHVEKREVKYQNSNGNNITAQVFALHDSHQQLMVHWAGEGSNVIVCLARDGHSDVRHRASAVFVSYDYGDSYTNRTDAFRLSPTPSFATRLGRRDADDEPTYAVVDKFYTHPKFNTHCVFVDKVNKYIFVTSDYAKTIDKIELAFTPAEILFYPLDPMRFIASDDQKNLWITQDFGSSWQQLEQNVKSFAWATALRVSLTTNAANSKLQLLSVDAASSSAVDAVEPLELPLAVERLESGNSSTVILVGTAPSMARAHRLTILDDVYDLQVKGDMFFAKRKADKAGELDLYVKYKSSEFRLARFDSDSRLPRLPRLNYQVVDVTDTRLMVAVTHARTLTHLYVAEWPQLRFRLSLERVMCYVHGHTWTDSWLSDVADASFTDFHKVNGLHGIYIASQVSDKFPPTGNIGPEHLESVITFNWGGEWRSLTPPQVDAHGNPTNCQLKANCALHLSQEFSKLHPISRASPILSSKSAPGLIVAAGVLGRSLKGHVGLFLSRDAGLTWHHVLDQYHLFNFGDHGGVLTAVSTNKFPTPSASASDGQPNKLLYSTDEGESWKSQPFSEDERLHIYGLMTEPGENTTIFTMFGSGVTKHRWLIIKVDLAKAFAYNCSQEDYKVWSPSSEAGPHMPCVLGRKETYQRRNPHSNCYNGRDYDRPITTERCRCQLEDFECDFGFERKDKDADSGLSSSICVINKKMLPDYYEPPASCQPGGFYNRSRGYRKIEEDECDGGEEDFLPDLIACPYNKVKDFLVVAQKTRIVRYDLSNLVADVLPLPKMKNVVALEFDAQANCVYWADISNSSIQRQCLSDGVHPVETLLEYGLASVEGMSLDWITNMLYFVDGIRARIEVIRTDINWGGRMRRTIVGPKELKKPRGVAVHPVKGYLFWTDWAVGAATVSRAGLDGSQIRRLFAYPQVIWPNGIAIDFHANRLYWVDARDDYIASADLDGKHFFKVISGDARVAHPFAVAVFKGNMYWDDWKQASLFVGDKDHGVGVETLAVDPNGLMDMKVVSASLLQLANARTLPCSTATCSHLCFNLPGGKSHSCLCPDDLIQDGERCLCDGNVEPYANSTCPVVDKTCAPSHFRCATNKVCVSKQWLCDGDDDCGDNSDEAHDLCGHIKTCAPSQFRCGGGQCVPQTWRCDVDTDCPDGSDEANCTYTKCTAEQYECANKRCISKRWLCDGENDCRDNSDELNCPNANAKNSSTAASSSATYSCPPGTLGCRTAAASLHCIPLSWRCDGQVDCDDSADEANCDKQECAAWQFKCAVSKRCVFESWRCDGEPDCGPNDNSDELNCTNGISTPTPPALAPTTPPALVCSNTFTFKCADGRCIPFWWKCDGVNDCGDNGDEIGCAGEAGGNGTIAETPTVTPTKAASASCQDGEFQCQNDICIPESWVCDGQKDCMDGDDEADCQLINACLPYDNKFKCRHDGSCIYLSQVCDGVVNCPDKSDEAMCAGGARGGEGGGFVTSSPGAGVGGGCSLGQFACDVTTCLPLANLCNGHRDCLDGQDENNCQNTTRIYQVLDIGVDERSMNATSLRIFWWTPYPPNVKFEFMPAYKQLELRAATWVNASLTWLNGSDHLLTNLRPYTSYNITVYLRVLGQQIVHPPAKYIIATTTEGVPDAAWDVRVEQKSGREVEVKWRAPHRTNGRLRDYLIYYSPPTPPLLTLASPNATSVLLNSYFVADQDYSIWVVARNGRFESEKSPVARMRFDGAAVLHGVSGLVVEAITENSVSLSWQPTSNADGYLVRALVPVPYPQSPSNRTVAHSFTVTDLAPGVDYTFEVSAYKKHYEGTPSSIIVKTKGFELPAVSGVEAELAVGVGAGGNVVDVRWRAPPPDHSPYKNTAWQYGVYYAQDLKSLFQNGPRLVTSNTYIRVGDLQGCSSYVFDVGVVGPRGPGPLSAHPHSLLTPVLAGPPPPPRHLRLTTPEWDETEMLVTWDAACPLVQHPTAYRVRLQEWNGEGGVMLNSSLVVPSSTNSSLSTSVRMRMGAHYRVCVEGMEEGGGRVAGAGGEVCGEHVAMPLPVPSQLHVFTVRNGSAFVYWKEVDPALLKYFKLSHYVVLMSAGSSLEVGSARRFTAHAPPLIIDADALQPNGIHSFAVQIVTQDRFASPLSHTIALDTVLAIQLGGGVGGLDLAKEGVVGGGLLLLVLAVAGLGSALAFYVYKSRRLQNNFTRFANSHYNTRSGSATFLASTNNTLEEEEEDSPVIRGFSDDEPLVIA